MSSSFAYEDPLIRQQQQAIGAISTSTTTKAREIFAEMGRGMWKSGKGFAKVTVLFAGTECVIESVGPFFSLSPSGPTRVVFVSWKLMCCWSFRARSTGLGTISETRSRPGLSLEASWRATLGREVRCGEVLGFQRSRQRSICSCGERHQSECIDPGLVRIKFTNVPAAKISSPAIYRHPIVDYTRLQSIILWLPPLLCPAHPVAPRLDLRSVRSLRWMMSTRGKQMP